VILKSLLNNVILLKPLTGIYKLKEKS
jgi:hypothetical protein